MKRKTFLILGWLAILMLAMLWRLNNIDAFGLNNDEGAYLMWARLVADGYPLYSQTHSVSAPLFIEGLALVFKLFGFSIVGGRMTIMATFALLALALGWLAHRIAGWPGAFAALAMVVLPTPFFQLSRQVMAEIPASLFAVLAVWGGWLYFAGHNQRWLALAGLALAISLLIKTLYPAAVLPIAWFIWRNEKSWRNKFMGGLAFALPLLATLIVVISFFNWTAFYNQVILFRSDLRAVAPWDWQQNWQMLMAFAQPLWGLGLLAGAGLLVSARRPRAQAWALWLLGDFALLMWHSPLFPHHSIILLPPAILLAVEFIEFTFYDLRFTERRSTLVLGTGLVLGTLFSVPNLIHLNQGWLDITTGGREAEAARMLNKVTRPTDFVVTDSQLFALLANRRTPPPLGDIALVAIKAGRQSSDRLIQMSEDYDVQAVANWALRLPWLPDYLAWAEQNFWVHKIWDNDHQLYFGRKLPPGAPIPNPQTVRLGEAIQLRGFSVDASQIRPGGSLPLTLYWQATAPVPTDFTVFVQVLDSRGKLAAQMDGQPIHGYFPTSQWPVGEFVPDQVDVPLPADLPAGTYTVITGMYNLQTLERLPVAENGTNFIRLTDLAFSSGEKRKTKDE